MRTFGETLKKLRAKKNLSQQEVSNRLGINRASYARYETDSTEADFETLQKLADFYGVSIDFLLGRDEITLSKDVPIDLEEYVMNKERLMFRGIPLNESERKQIRNILRGLFMDDLESKGGSEK
ncbi:hypothetical protein SD70_29725 [Gordoniibacillus kamchatkensis]|uniref:HTH cro/C1-type domain-containing protein n=1 Tax=Gordoniibacillus kamchatkensis TaxID=1590651 RepID=A0ABR5AA81_9BACL|nr:helix-turn-helix transcriptional regulator [Paenibacillus sp. VKM B-2647]KIL37965.1 hypothetical protein SD70_29725 [Paenibacillus sp. VKM B-2647]